MADGFVKIPNKLYAAIMTYGFNSTKLIVVLYILRQTYGWNKTKDKIAISKMAKDLGKPRQHISKIVSDLEKDCVVGIERYKNGIPPIMWIQDPEKWTKPVSVHFHASTGFHESKSLKNLSAHTDTPVSARMQVPVSARMHTKDIYTDTLIKDKTTDMPAAPLILSREEQEEMFPDSEGWSW